MAYKRSSDMAKSVRQIGAENRMNKCGNLFCGDMLEMFSGKGLLKYHLDLPRYRERILISVFRNSIIRSKVCRMTSSALCLSGGSVVKMSRVQ